MTSHVLHPFERYDQSTIAPGRSQFLLQLSYQGNHFNGVPPQPGLPSVTAALQKQLTHSLGHPLKALTFTARTDKGVHADVNYATGWLRDGPQIPAGGLQIIPQDSGLGTIQMFQVPEATFARTLAVSKTYSYRFRDGFLASEKDSLSYWDILPKLDLSAMQQAAACILGTHSFSSFQVRPGKENRNSMCTIYSAQLETCHHPSHQELVFTIRGDRFLRRMVRTLAGTLAEIGCGLMRPETIKTFINHVKPEWVGPTAPARGLTLRDIEIRSEFQKLFG